MRDQGSGHLVAPNAHLGECGNAHQCERPLVVTVAPRMRGAWTQAMRENGQWGMGCGHWGRRTSMWAVRMSVQAEHE